MAKRLSSVDFAKQWAGKATSIALAMVAPGALGILGDKQLQTTPGLSISGFVFGFCYGLWRLIRLANQANAPSIENPSTTSDTKTSTSSPHTPGDGPASPPGHHG